MRNGLLCKQDVIERLIEEKEKLRKSINCLQDEQPHEDLQAKRYGLPVFQKERLKQHYEYLDGLFSYRVEKQY